MAYYVRYYSSNDNYVCNLCMYTRKHLWILIVPLSQEYVGMVIRSLMFLIFYRKLHMDCSHWGKVSNNKVLSLGSWVHYFSPQHSLPEPSCNHHGSSHVNPHCEHNTWLSVSHSFYSDLCCTIFLNNTFSLYQ